MSIEALPKILLSEASMNIDESFLNKNLSQLNSINNGNENLFLDAIVNTDNKIKYADDLAARYINGEDIPVHDMVIAMNKAKTEVQLLVEVRNKIFDAYQEISKLQI